MATKKQTPSVRVPEKTYIKLLKLRTKRRAKGERISIGALIAEAVETLLNPPQYNYRNSGDEL